MPEEELDFDDPSFLLPAPTPTSELTYAEKRKRTLALSHDKSRAPPSKRSRKQQEEDAREEGLRRNLIARDTEEGESKALKMMKGMGFKPGEGLGRKRDEDEGSAGPAASGSGRGGIGSGIGAGGGIGSGIGSRAHSNTPDPPAAEQPKARTEPIMFQMREGRKGLGIPQENARPRAFPPELLAKAEAARASTPLPDVNLYLERNKGLFDDRTAQGVLRSVRKTLEELDRRNGIEESVMWKAPADAVRDERKARARRAFRGGDADLDEDFGVDVVGERAALERSAKRGGLEYETGVSAVVVDDEDDEDKADREEEEEWLGFDSRVRLALTLGYLRKTYNYCVWCGCQYNDADDLKTSCPGEDEGDH